MIVKVGTFVELVLIDRNGNSETMAVHLVDDKAADFAAGYLGTGTPLGRTILGQPVGKTLAYPIGDLNAVRIQSVSISAAKPEENSSERREEVIRKAVEESDRTNAILFASSFSGKWGDYDPEGIEKWESGKDKKSDDDDRNVDQDLE